MGSDAAEIAADCTIFRYDYAGGVPDTRGLGRLRGGQTAGCRSASGSFKRPAATPVRRPQPPPRMRQGEYPTRTGEDVHDSVK